MTDQRPAPDGPPAAGALPRARLLLLAVAIVLVIHGSLYPWHFEMPASFAEALDDMIGRRRWWTRWDDVGGNVLLFLPLGALGQWLLLDRLGRRGAAVAVQLSGTALALALQVLQLLVPWRDAELTDVLWNAVGLSAGIALAVLTPAAQLGLGGPPAGRSAEESAQLRLASLLIALWLALQWWPFLPASSFTAIHAGLLMAWLSPHWSWIGALDVALGVLVIAELTRPLPRRGRLLLALGLLTVVGRLFTIHAALPPSVVAGALAGMALAGLAWRAPAPWLRQVLFWTVVLWFVADALRPYRLAPFPREFHWLPFATMLHGSMLGNLLSLCWSLFWLGAAVALGGAGRGASGRVTLLIMLGVALLEALQTRLPGRTADITPALLPALWWLVSHAALPVARRRANR